MKNTMMRLWYMMLLAAGYFCAFIGIVIGIPGRLLTDISEGLGTVYGRLNTKAADHLPGFFEEDRTEVIYE